MAKSQKRDTRVNVFQNFKHRKRKNTLNVFSLLTNEAKGSNKFCIIFGIFLFEIKICLYEFLEHYL